MSLSPTIESLKFLSAAIDAKQEKIDTALTPNRREQLSKQLESLQRRFSADYAQFVAASEKKGECAQTTEAAARCDTPQDDDVLSFPSLQTVRDQSESGHYSGMVADMFVSAESEDAVEELTVKHLESAGWTIEELEHAEEVCAPATHDARFADLYRNSRTNGVASIFSPY